MKWGNIKWKPIERYVFKLQKKIYQASKNNNKLEMTRLQKILLTSKASKLKAVRRVTQDNTGKKTAGVDNIKSLQPEKRLELANQLRLDGKASSIRRVHISKEKCSLGIPTIKDRAKQFLAFIILEPQWEAMFEPNSYGFRPGRSCHDAIEAVFIAINQKPKYVLDADIQGCFNEMDHNALLAKLNTFPAMEKQIKAWLKTGILENGVITQVEKSTPQGSLISPLLMNIALHGMEQAVVSFLKNCKIKDKDGKNIVRRRRSSSINTIRYADDFVVLHENELVIKSCKEFIKTYLADLGLKLKDSKTQIRHTLCGFENKKPGFDFLGFNIRQYEIGKYTIRKTKVALKHRTLIRPSKDKITGHFKTMKEVLKKTRKTEVLLMELNPKIIGWARYYRAAVSYRTFKWLDTLLFKALLKWQYKKHSTKSRKWLNNVYYHKKGNRKWVFGFKSKDNNELITIKRYADIPIERFIKVRGDKSPYDGDILYWSLRLSNYPVMSGNVSKILKRQKGCCNLCGLPFFPTDIIERDHITPLSKGGSHKMNNMQLLHGHCHKTKTAMDRELMRN
jgi:RNA-directed DNA polymerase